MGNNKIVLTLLIIFCFPFFSFALTPEEIVVRVDQQFAQIRDAQGNFTLDTTLQILGCGGRQRRQGQLWFRYPDKIKIKLDGDLFFFKGNQIRKIDKKGQRFYLRLINAPDFSVGFCPKLISHNFYLTLLRQTTDEAVLEGLPKPGVLKNVKKVIFYIDTRRWLLKKLDLAMTHNLTGYSDVKYEKIKGLDVPTATWGKSALEVFSGSLAGLVYDLRGSNFKVNTNLPESLFNPGF